MSVFQIFAVFMMCTAACVFGLILGELQELYAAANSKTREMEESTAYAVCSSCFSVRILFYHGFLI